MVKRKPEKGVRYLFRKWYLTPLLLLLSGVALAGDPAAQADRLIQAGQLQEAADFAAEQFGGLPPQSVDAADWAVLTATLRQELLLRAPLAAEADLLAAAVRPLDDLLAVRPVHRSAPWLRFQRLAIESAVAQRHAMVVLASPGDDTRRLKTLSAMIHTAGQLRDLQAEVVDAIAIAFHQRKSDTEIDRLIALRNTIAIERVGLLLQRGDLFPPTSNDRLASAEEADRAAIEALAMIRDQPQLTASLIRLRCEALVRLGRTAEAAHLLTNLMLSESDQADADAETGADRGPAVISDATLAVIVKVRLAQGNVRQAGQWLAERYGDSPAETLAPVDLDLARLRWLLHTRDDHAGIWIEAMRVRGGEFAYRRGLATAIEMLGPESALLGNSALVIANAARMLRSGNATAAAQNLAAAASAAGDETQARELAVAAAAALVHLQEVRQAAQLLYDTAVKFDQSPSAAELMLQAAVTLDRESNNRPATEQQIDRWLSELMERWPEQPSVGQARRWLADRIAQRGDLVAAASTATPQHGTAVQPADWDHALDLWLAALLEIDWHDDDLTSRLTSGSATGLELAAPLSESYVEIATAALQRVGQPSSEAGQRCQRFLTALLADRQTLPPVTVPDVTVPDAAAPAVGAPPLETTDEQAVDQADDQAGVLDPALRRQQEEALVRWLIAARQNLSRPPPLSVNAVDSQRLRRLAARRLLTDARGDATASTAIAAAVIRLTDDCPLLDSSAAQALIGSGRWEQAAELLDGWAAGQHTQQQHQQAQLRAAWLLALSSQRPAQSAALTRLTRLAEQLPAGEPLWYRVKLATIQTMQRLGDAAAARQLASYLLITRPPQDAELTAALERLSR